MNASKGMTTLLRGVMTLCLAATAPPLLAQSTLPPEKQAIEQKYQQERATGSANPAPRNPNAAYPTIADAPFDTGIVDGPDGPFSSQEIRISNRWQGTINGVATAVYAGAASPDDGGQGTLIVLSDGANGTTRSSILSPVQGGALRIVAAQGGLLKLVSSTGSFVLTLNLSTGQFTSVVVDTAPPAIAGLPPTNCVLWPPNHKMIQVAMFTASDALSGLVPGSFTVTGTSNEPSSASDPDIVITPMSAESFVVQLRADRLGTGTGRIYTLVAKATDQVGNVAKVTATCTVPHDQGK